MKAKFSLSARRFGELAVCAISAWCVIAWLLAIPAPGAAASVQFVRSVSVGKALLIFGAAFLCFAISTRRWPIAPYLLLISMTLYGTNALYTAGNQYFYLIILAVFAPAAAYVIHEDHS
ncbi:MAG: hypothetical protein IJC15_07945, partial [Clostridia bacterium]|nr:hypothetical protein [Clostridia bacterium]